jgi:hypothetical protein
MRATTASAWWCDKKTCLVLVLVVVVACCLPLTFFFLLISPSTFDIPCSLFDILYCIAKKIPASATWQGDRMKFRRELIQEKAMAETMRDDKGTTKFNNCQYLIVVFF